MNSSENRYPVNVTVVDENWPYGWFVSKRLSNDNHVYLHQDFVWRDSARHEGKYTGYFETQEVAIAARDKASKASKA